MEKCLGVFDSGIGGLSVLRELIKLEGYDRVVYFGDTGRVPYGTRSEHTITEYARQDVKFLLSKGATEIAVACGTVSAIALDSLKNEFNVPIVGVIDAAVRDAVSATQNGVIGVIGTSATIKNGIYARKISEQNKNIKVVNTACPLFVPLVEYGFATRDEDETVRSACRYYLKEIKDSGADTIILGCTHYPVIAKYISEYIPGIKMINIGKSLSASLGKQIGKGTENIEYYVSDDADGFCQNASAYLGEELGHPVTKIDIQNY